MALVEDSSQVGLKGKPFKEGPDIKELSRQLKFELACVLQVEGNGGKEPVDLELGKASEPQ